MRSSDIARVAGVTTRALRHYHSIGLLPEPPRSQNGYREYDEFDLARVLHIKRLASLGFSLAHIKAMTEDASGPVESPHADKIANENREADAAVRLPWQSSREIQELERLDEELALRIEELQQQRKAISQLRKEGLDPSLPIRFAKAVKKLYGSEYEKLLERASEQDRIALLLVSNLYDEESLAELERFAGKAEEMEILEGLRRVEEAIDDLPPDAPENKRADLAAEAMAQLEPMMECFDPQNWEGTENEGMVLVESFVRASRNPAQRDVEDRIEAAILERIKG